MAILPKLVRRHGQTVQSLMLPGHNSILICRQPAVGQGGMDEVSARLHLKHEWTLGEPIGDNAGFGTVYAASSPEYPQAVVKLVPKEPGAERELLFGDDLGGVRNVVPVIDSGETADSWVLVMPRADKSLRAHLQAAAGPMGVAEAVAVLSDIATALSDLDGRVVHRDLKPENVLLLNGHWCVADFGISRYAEATTAPDTRKHAWTRPYAAPEQWRYDRATSATDIYALGIIAYELLAGVRPFTGPAADDYREQHLHGEAPALVSVPTALAALVEECLFKAPEARPTAGMLLARLPRASQAAPPGGLAQLEEANRAEVARRGEGARAASFERSAAERRADLVNSASKGLTRIMDLLKDAVMEAAPAANLQSWHTGGWKLTLNEAEFEFTAVTKTPNEPWGNWQAPAFEVVAHAALGVTVPRDRYEYEGRSHSLWYCDAQQASRYQWFETAFMISPLMSQQISRDPFARAPGIEAAKAVWSGIAEFEVAWPFTPLTVGDLDDFISRWAGWFAAAAQGQLRHPNTMPERQPQGSWRR